MFHLTTHAFFKALLFLGAGSVILALHHEQDIWKMGGLRKKMPVTFWTFIVGTLALCGRAAVQRLLQQGHHPRAGAPQHNLAALRPGRRRRGADARSTCSAWSSWRSSARRKSDAAGHAHESPPVMLWPLRILAVFSVIGGFIGIEQLYGRQFAADADAAARPFCGQLIAPVRPRARWRPSAGLLAVLVGFAAAWALYAKAAKDPLPGQAGRAVPRDARTASTSTSFTRPRSSGCTISSPRSPTGSTAGSSPALPCAARTAPRSWSGRALRLLQTGNLQTYAFLFALGVALVL